ncbi:MAG TPA: DUF3349 domain-containing protein [Trebonia sp.]|jgi:hypothetical protein|nr:DUF3349 domain-containing protein [Trebonia sp.]
MALPPVLSTIVEWLRAGYPEGVPDVDYIPLFALLGSQLTDSQVSAIADELVALASETGDTASAEAVKTAIQTVTQHKPLESDIARVRSRLAAGGWPLAAPGQGATGN